MESIIKTYTYPDGQLQRVQLVRLPDWERIEFLQPEAWEGALDCFADIYRKYLVPACPWIFGNMVLFRLPAGTRVPVPADTGKYGRVSDPLIAAAAALRQGIRIFRGKPVFRTRQAEALWKTLEQQECIRVVSGKLPVTTVIPVADHAGLLSRTESMKVNASFFIMDRFDCATVYDRLSIPFGLCVRQGQILLPPMYGREALLVHRDGSVRIAPVDIRQLQIKVGDKTYIPGQNCLLYTRPARAATPLRKGKKLVIVGSQVVAATEKLRVAIPASGFVLCPLEHCDAVSGDAVSGDAVSYGGMEDILFGIQVGNSILRGGEKTGEFISRFYNIRKLEPIPYPPSLYPMDYRKSRAARIALGADASGRPMLLWAEGAGKNGYTPGIDSCGASLSELADICSDLGMADAVNLDGGGSAQILLQNRRELRISDRDPLTGMDAERPVPLALMIQ